MHHLKVFHPTYTIAPIKTGRTSFYQTHDALQFYKRIMAAHDGQMSSEHVPNTFQPENEPIAELDTQDNAVSNQILIETNQRDSIQQQENQEAERNPNIVQKHQISVPIYKKNNQKKGIVKGMVRACLNMFLTGF